MQFSFIQDLGLAALLIFLAFFMRLKLGFLQRLFIPVSIIAGLLALTFGPNGFGYLAFSEQIGTYPGIMIAFLFGTLPFTHKVDKKEAKALQRDTLQMGGSTIFILVLQWGLGLLFGLTLLRGLYPDINFGFGSILAAGFFGGHGTAAAIGDTLATNLNWEDAKSLAMTSATVGILSATIGGIFMVQWAVRKGKTEYLKDFNQLPSSLRTGLIPNSEQRPMGKTTFSNIAIDPFVMHLMLALAVGIGGMYLTQWTKPLLGGYSIAAFSFAFILGLLLKWVLNKTKGLQYIDTQIMGRICGSFADLIVIYGIASIKLSVVVAYAGPLVLLFAFGLIMAVLVLRKAGPALFVNAWFEKSLFLWGMSLGVTAIGIALLRMVDPEAKSGTLPTFALGYISVTPFEVGCLVIFPILAGLGYHWYFTIGCLALALLLFLALRRYQKRLRKT
ncbi:sodium/glutamate symporter [Sediminicola luteus]|uniref:Sodium:glutamate symporter n=1 Tax=Sediminicola luteus TaxID=319238 RepID=A0A2A4GD78_9FLAO|nr:sodium/glutamate symporter [Sediminicola luteus]PCE65938.1 hypothetical protein B7P33_01145 [Sediminicola luteus]